MSFSSSLRAEKMGISGRHDLDQLWSRAREIFDPAGFDAIVLLESEGVSLMEKGDLKRKIHRVVWISTGVAIHEHADLRIPYNSNGSSMKVLKLRTWRGGRWWPDEKKISDTAVVETVPHALALADDYSTVRETMLLHDGIELPCILETEYEITGAGEANDGCDGLFIFARRDPVVMSAFSLDLPPGAGVRFATGNGTGDPEIAALEGGGKRYRWMMEDPGRLSASLDEDHTSYAPYLAWSTWKDWKALASKIMDSFNGAADPGASLADTAAARARYEPGTLSKMRKIASLVDEFTTNIAYDAKLWSFSPRPAVRTYETAYGHSLDRAVLAASLMRSIGIEAWPFYRSAGTGDIDMTVPGLSRFGDIMLIAGEGEVTAVYDPSTGRVTGRTGILTGRTVFMCGEDGDTPSRFKPVHAGKTGLFELTLTIDAGMDKEAKGKGYLNASNILSPYDDMAGLGGQAPSYLGRLAGAVLPGAETESYDIELFSEHAVKIGFDFSGGVSEAGDGGRVSLIAGEPEGGIFSFLGRDVHLYQEKRESPVCLPSGMVQKISLVIETVGREVIYIPEEVSMENEAGSFLLTVRNEEGRLIVDRTLSIDIKTVPASMWPRLRTLLLEWTDQANRTVILK